MDEVPKTGDVQQRKKLVQYSGNDLPVRLTFCDSLYGVAKNGSCSFDANDMIDVHFMKQTLTLNARFLTGIVVKIPLHADFEFSFLYNPERETCLKPAVELVKTIPLPKVVVVKEGYKSTTDEGKDSFFEGEILILKESIKKSIKCFSIISRSEKSFDKSSRLVFIVNPSNIKLPIAETIHIPFPIAADIKLYPGSSRLEKFFQTPCTFCSLTTESSLIATMVPVDLDNYKQASDLFEISQDIPIEFYQVLLSRQDMQSLFEKSILIYESFAPSKVADTIFSLSKVHPVETSIYDMSRKDIDKWMDVVELCKPTYHQVITEPSCNGAYMPLNSELMDSSVNVYMKIRKCSEQDNYSSAASTSTNTADGVLLTNNHYSSHGTSTGPQVADFKPNIEEEVIYEEISSELGGKLMLETLSEIKIIELLHILGLSEYESTFKREKISGALLKEIDDEILEKELGITSRLHRMKLVSIIEGEQSLDELFNEYI